MYIAQAPGQEPGVQFEPFLLRLPKYIANV